MSRTDTPFLRSFGKRAAQVPRFENGRSFKACFARDYMCPRIDDDGLHGSYPARRSRYEDI